MQPNPITCANFQERFVCLTQDLLVKKLTFQQLSEEILPELNFIRSHQSWCKKCQESSGVLAAIADPSLSSKDRQGLINILQTAQSMGLKKEDIAEIFKQWIQVRRKK